MHGGEPLTDEDRQGWFEAIDEQASAYKYHHHMFGLERELTETFSEKRHSQRRLRSRWAFPHALLLSRRTRVRLTAEDRGQTESLCQVKFGPQPV